LPRLQVAQRRRFYFNSKIMYTSLSRICDGRRQPYAVMNVLIQAQIHMEVSP